MDFWGWIFLFLVVALVAIKLVHSGSSE
jgi:hypothetical protein